MKAYDAEALKARKIPDNGRPEPTASRAYNFFMGYAAALETVRSVINAEPIIEAVPLLPLCKLLAEINGKPCYTQPGQEMCEATLGDYKCCGMNDTAGCWERLLRAWMDNGMEDYT